MVHEKRLKLPLVWQLISSVRNAVDEELKDYSAVIRELSSMVAAELMSNAIKYGECVERAQEAHFSLLADEHTIDIRVSSGLRDSEAALRLKDRIEKIMASPDVEGLYLNRFHEILNNPEEVGKIGLLRVVYEGQFSLASIYENQVFTVIASRGVA